MLLRVDDTIWRNTGWRGSSSKWPSSPPSSSIASTRSPPAWSSGVVSPHSSPANRSAHSVRVTSSWSNAARLSLMGRPSVAAHRRNDGADDPKQRDEDPDDEHHPVALAEAEHTECDRQHKPEDSVTHAINHGRNPRTTRGRLAC